MADKNTLRITREIDGKRIETFAQYLEGVDGWDVICEIDGKRFDRRGPVNDAFAESIDMVDLASAAN